MAQARPQKAESAAQNQVRFGCSSFSSEDWVGPFYPKGTPPRDFLRVYAARFDTVEIDATYYAVPRASMVDGWRDKTPEGFLICAKFPRTIVHGGKGPTPDANVVLQPEATYDERDAFLESISRLGDRLGTLVLQFPYFTKKLFADEREFFDRLDRFLLDLPPEFHYAVEVRNRNWLSPDLAHICRRHDVSLVLVDQAWMPHGDEVVDRFDPVTSQPVYVRLLGDRKEIEAITRTWDTEVMDRRERLRRWAHFLVRLQKRGVSTLVYVNNHYAGHAPTTVQRLQEMYQAALAESR
jgi:uncharacterized protein YecE (DUF72 family)